VGNKSSVDALRAAAYREPMEYAPKKITVEGFKSIRSLKDLELRGLNVLIGANGGGKSNFISLFDLFGAIAHQRLQHYALQHGADALLHFGRSVTERITISVDFAQNEYRAVLIPTTKNSLIFESEDCWGELREFVYRYKVAFGTGHLETGLPEEVKRVGESTISGHVLRALKSWKVYHFHDTSANAKLKQTGDLEDNVELRPDASNLAAFLYRLRERRRPHYDQIVETVRLAAPFFQDFDLKPSRLNPDKIRLEWLEYGSTAYFDGSSLSDGTLRFMCLTTLLLQPDPPETIVVDEPELGLHPYAITLLAGMLRSAAAQRRCVIISTQSVPLVNQFAPEDIVVVEREEGQSTFKRLPGEGLANWLEEYGLGDLWEKNVIGGRPRR
jgi:predicted ATPase